MLSFSDDIASVPEVLILQQIHLRVTDICTMQKRNWMVGRPGNEANSGVAKLGHTGARALATRGCAPPVQALSVPNVNRELLHKGVEIELRSIAIGITRSRMLL